MQAIYRQCVRFVRYYVARNREANERYLFALRGDALLEARRHASKAESPQQVESRFRPH